MALNKVFLIGNLTADPELKTTQTGTSVTNFTIAVQRRFAKDGQQSADFINVVAWKQTAEFVCKYFNKGKPILVCGSIQVRDYTDNNGNKRYVTEVIADEVSFVGGKNDNANPSDNTPAFQADVPAHFEDVTDDEGLPFGRGAK